MRVQHNIMAMNAYRNYNNNTKALSGNLEKLSSGYKINRAGDDAAGLAISEKMRSQITGLEAAQKNVKDGTSLVKTAEGAMQEVQDMLKRMKYLAVQSANGTYQDEVDRENLQKEVESLKTEINRIADSANFNGIKLLDGSLGEGGSSTVTAAAGLKSLDPTSSTDAVIGGPEAQAGKWELDLNQYKFDATQVAETVFTIKVNNKIMATVTLASTGTNLTTADMEVDTVGATVIGGASVNVSFEDGKLIIEMDNTPTTNATTGLTTGMPGALSVSFGGTTKVNVANTSGKKDTIDKLKASMTTTQAAIAPGTERLYGQATYTLDADIVKDGMTLKIGNESYTFAVGAASEFKGGKNVIDLTDFEDADIATGLTSGEIADRVVAAFANNSQFTVGRNGTSGAIISLVEKEGSGLDKVGSAIVGKDNKVGNDATWKNIVQYGKAQASSNSGGGLTLQIGDTADDFNQMNVIIGDMHTTGGMNIDDIDIGTLAGAQKAIGVVTDATNYVSSIRGDLGAIQNRLDHTLNNLSVMAENIQDAESTIRDTDVAEEMMSYVKNNILVQSAQAMLAQANQVPQGVLQLLG